MPGTLSARDTRGMDEALRLLDFAGGARVAGRLRLARRRRPSGPGAWHAALDHGADDALLRARRPARPPGQRRARRPRAPPPPRRAGRATRTRSSSSPPRAPRVAGRPGAEERLADALAHAERRFWREDEGAVVDDPGEAYRGANANMHTVEAFLAAADATGDPRLGRPRAAHRDAADRRRRPRGRVARPGALRRGLDAAARVQRRRAAPPVPALRRHARARARVGAAAAPPARGARRPARMAGARGRARSPTARGRTAGTRSAAASPTRPTAPAARSWPTGSTGSSARRSPRRRCSATQSGSARRALRRAPPHRPRARRLAARARPGEPPRVRTWQGKPDVYHALQADAHPRPAAAPERRRRARSRRASSRT